MRMLSVPYWANKRLNTDTSDLFNQMDYLVNEFTKGFPADFYKDKDTFFLPACELSENDQEYFVSVDLPGMNKDDIKIEVKDKYLTITGERKKEVSSDKKDKVQFYERSYGYFKRGFQLGSAVDENKIEASYNDGVLDLRLPKAEAAKPKQIEIKTGK